MEPEQTPPRYIILRDLMAALKETGTRLEDAAEWIDNDESLRICADGLQAVREHFWPLWLEESRKANDK